MADENKEIARVSNMSIEIEVQREGEAIVLFSGETLYLNDLVKANNCTAYLEKLDGEGVMVQAHKELLLDESFQGVEMSMSKDEGIEDENEDESNVEDLISQADEYTQEEELSIESLIEDADKDIENEDISTQANTPLQWLEARGQLQGSASSKDVNHFIEEHKSQATYLTQLSGAITIEEDGSWLFLINQNALGELDENGLKDSVVINSADGVKHELEFYIGIQDAQAYVKEVVYQGISTEAVLEKEDILDSVNVQETVEREEPIEVSLDTEDLLKKLEKEDEAKKEVLIPEIKEESIDSEAMLQRVQERMQLKEQERKSQALQEAQALEKEEKEKLEEKERQEKAEEEARILQETELAKALANEKEMLAQVAIRMKEKEKELEAQARQDAIEEQARQEAQEKADEEAREQKEKEAREAMGGDERLLKIQALMNAPKQFDLAEVEMIGGDEPSKAKKEEVEVSEEDEVKEEVVEAMQDEDTNKACLKDKIVLAGAEVFRSSSYLEGFSLEADGSYHFEPHAISFEYLSEGAQEVSTVKVSVTKNSGEKLLGELHLIVKRIDGALSLSASMDEFVQESKTKNEAFQEMSLDELAGSGEEFSHHSQVEEDEEAPLEGHLAVIFDSLKDGATLRSDGTLGITILLPTGVQAGEAIIVNGSEFTITGPEADAGTLLYCVYPDDEVEVSYRDCDNNISDSIRAHANRNSLELLDFVKVPEIMGEVGSQSVHAGLGEPTHKDDYWGVVNASDEIVTYMDSEFASLKVDHETGELEYRYYEGSGLAKYGKSADEEVCEKFIISLGNKPYAQLEVHIHIQVQSIHGYNGQEIDSTIIKEMKLLKYDPDEAIKPKENVSKDNNMLEMLEAGLASNKAKISKVMLEIYEAKSAGQDISEAKDKLQSLTDKKTHLEDKLNSLK